MMKRAEILIEALPYIKRFTGKTFVIKYGGSVMEDETLKKKFIEDVALLKLVGINIVIVHGGGKRINAMLNQVDLDVKFQQGQRVTDEHVMKIVEMVLSGQVNKDLSACLSQHGLNAVGLCGRDSNLLKAVKNYAVGQDGEKLDLGYVGKVSEVNKAVLTDLIGRRLCADHLSGGLRRGRRDVQRKCRLRGGCGERCSGSGETDSSVRYQGLIPGY